jgi:lipopolysaccharide export system protein LptA
VRFTIEKLRTVILIAGVLLVGALVVFLARGRLKSHFKIGELPSKLGYDIAADATGFTLDHAYGGHSRYRIHASKAVQYKDNHAILHDVLIELYGADGTRVDRIESAEFDYDKQSSRATANGPVAITLMRPGVAPAIAPNASTGKAQKGKPTPIASAAQTAERGEIHVKTSGLTFDTNSGVATTEQHVDFSMVQGNGSSTGATYDSKQGFLVLDKTVELNTKRGNAPVQIHAQHAEFERDTDVCRMHVATADYRGGTAKSGDAKILFRTDGSVVHLDAMNGFDMVTATGSHVTAPLGAMDFDEHNQPRHGHLQGGVKMDSSRQTKDGAQQRTMSGSAPTADLEFTSTGQLRHMHMERGVRMESQTVSQPGAGSLRVHRTWTSPIADMDFRDNGHGQAEPKTVHGVQGVVITGESQRGNAPAVPSRLAADEVTGEFGPNSALSSMTGTGHASVSETTVTGTQQNVVGDSVEAHFVQPDQQAAHPSAPAANKGLSFNGGGNGGSESQAAAQIQSAIIDGHVLITQQAATRANAAPPAILRAWAGHAVYEGEGELLHLTVNPRVEDGGMQMTADKIDVARESGDAFAHGNVKATWLGNNAPNAGQGSKAQANKSQPGATPTGSVFGGKDPTHVVSAEAQMHHATSEATFRGHARLWQTANSVAGPVIVLDQQKQTLVAHSSDPAEPVKAVLLSTGSFEPGAAVNKPADASANPQKKSEPSVIRVRGGDLKYSDAEHKAIMRAGAIGNVVAQTPTATSVSDQVELILLPPGNHAGKDGTQAQVDRMTARGHVVVNSDGRHGTGEQLVYTGETGDYVLTGTAAAPPRMSDPTRGIVSGDALIFHSRDDSVSIEGGSRRTTTDTTTQK